MKHIRHILFITVVILCTAFAASAQDVSKQESRKAKLEKEIELLDKQIKENASKSTSLLSSLDLVRKNIENRKALVKESDKEIKLYSDSLYLAQRHINKLQARVDTLTTYYAKLVKSAYKNRDAKVWYMYILASEDLGQAYRRFGYFRNLSTRMKEEATKIRELKAEVEKEKERLAVLKKRAEKIKADRVKELEKLRADETSSANMVAKLKKDKKKYENQLKAKKKEIEALNKEIKRIIAEATKSKGQSSKKDDPEAIALSAEFSKNKGKLPWPVNGSVVAKFGKQYHPVYKNLELPPNNGIDIAVSKGTEVKAVFKGVVSQVFVMPGYNQCVLISHGNYFTFYCKLKSVNVKAGEKVDTGEVIGKTDTINGESQLHFEVWQGTKPQNPSNWLR